MSAQEHPSWQDELMPYADGELQADHAAQVAAHLEACSECAQAVEDARGLSLQMTSWTVEDAPEHLTESVLDKLPRKSVPARAWWTRGRMFAYGFCPIVLVVVVLTAMPSFLRSRQAADAKMLAASGLADLTELELDQSKQAVAWSMQTATPPELGQQGQGQGQVGTLGRIEIQTRSGTQTYSGTVSQPQEIAAPAGPMVIRTSRLILITKEFDAARTRIEAIVRDSKGYIDQLSVRSDPGSAKGLSAVLRFPSDKVDAGLAQLRKLGRPKEETQNSSDVTSQYVDLMARLNNARNTEQRLITLLRERTGRLQDVIEAEREIARVRESIEQMAAELKNVNNRVQYATVHVEVIEEYRAALEPSAPGTGTRLRNAAIEGYEFATETVLGIVLSILAYGPALLVWCVLLAAPAFLVWRVRQRTAGAGVSSSEPN